DFSFHGAEGTSLGTITPPSGWTIDTDTLKATHSGGGSTTEPLGFTAYKKVGASEAGAVTFSWSGGNRRVVACLREYSHSSGFGDTPTPEGYASNDSGQSAVQSHSTGTATATGAD